MSEIKNKRIVEYITTEVDNNNILHIHMEFCSDNLKNILENKHLVFNRAKSDQMTELEYFISCKIFIELLEGLNYLHELETPIIHRDVKPGNILFTEKGIKNGSFFVYCDFGLAKIYEDISHTKDVGTGKYMAPEVLSEKYNTKADVYSLSIVAQQLFDLSNNLSRNDKLGRYFKIIEQLLEKMRKINQEKRATCKNILDDQNKWCLSYIPSIDFLFNDSIDCQSLNVYIKHYFDSVLLDITIEPKDKECYPRYVKGESIIDKFLICNDISEKLKKIIKYFYVFKINSDDYEEKLNILFVTTEDEVCALGNNNHGILGLGHQNEVKEVNIIPEICYESVNNFYNSDDFVLCLTSYNRLYSWGQNDHGQLGIGKLSNNEISKPTLIEYFNDKTIVQICCGYQFSSVLTSDGRVHLWGKYGHIYDEEEKFFVTSTENELKEEIKSIHCSRNQTFCVTISGNIYYCENINNDRIRCIKLDTISNIRSITSSNKYNYFISCDSIIYIFDEEIYFETQPKKIIKSYNFKRNSQTISVYGLNSVIHSCVYELIEESCNKTNYKNPFDYYCDKHQVTYKTIELNVEEEDEKANNIESNVLDAFSITKQAIVDNINIEYFHVFDENNIIFVTEEDDVYGYGTNKCGCCGLGSNNALNKPELIRELCDRRVIRFYSGGQFTFALTTDHKLYAWGKINSKDSYSTPIKIFKSIWEIDNICCSRDHALILTRNGIVYGWGNNANGQIDNVQTGYFSKCIELNKLPTIKLIACSTKKSFAVSDGNDLYIWKDEQLKDEQSESNYMIIKFSDCISNICATDSLINNLYILIIGQIFYLDSISTLFKKIECPDHFISIYSIKSNRIIAMNGYNIYWITNDNNAIKTKFQTIFDYCAKKYQMTYKTINLKLQNEIHSKSLQIRGIVHICF